MKANYTVPYPRFDTKTGDGIDAGYYIEVAGEHYEHLEDAERACISAGYESYEEAFEDEFIFWTEWNYECPHCDMDLDADDYNFVAKYGECPSCQHLIGEKI